MQRRSELTSQAVGADVVDRDTDELPGRLAGEELEAEMRRLAAEYGARGVRFFLVHVDPDLEEMAALRHAEDYDLIVNGIKDERDLARQVGLLAESGQVEQAIRAGDALVARHPDSAMAYFARSYALRYGGLLQRSIEDCENALRLDPSSAQLTDLAIDALRADRLRLDQPDHKVLFLPLDEIGLHEPDQHQPVADHQDGLRIELVDAEADNKYSERITVKATTTIKRSKFGIYTLLPVVSDDVNLYLSIDGVKLDTATTMVSELQH